MNRILLFILFFSSAAFAQNKKTSHTLYKDGKPLAIAYLFQNKDQCIIESLNEKKCIEIHAADISVNNKKGYLLTFLNDNQQAFFLGNKLSINVLQKIIIQENLLSNNDVNEKAESLYIKAHPLPNGYVDVRAFNDIEVE